MRVKNLLWERKYINRTILVFASVMVLAIFHNDLFSQNGGWSAPANADSYNNPYRGNEEATLLGKKLYVQYCAICHGNKGKGDGVAGMALKPRPADLTKDAVQKQTDGAIYWKVTEGNAPMAAYKETLTKEQRWQLVNYIRALKK